LRYFPYEFGSVLGETQTHRRTDSIWNGAECKVIHWEGHLVLIDGGHDIELESDGGERLGYCEVDTIADQLTDQDAIAVVHLGKTTGVPHDLRVESG